MSVSGTIIPSDDATLSGLTLEGATNGETVDLSPAFHVDTFAYTALVANNIDAVTLTATRNESDAAVAITGDDASTPDTADLDLDVGANTLTVTVTAEDTTTTLTYTITVTRNEARPDPTVVPTDWGLIPRGTGAGDQFRLIFLSSTKRDASSASIGTYNTFIQNLVANGHTEIQAYSDGFRVVGCTDAVDARDNTSTRHNSADRGVPIYWLGGNKVADEYQDFYDETWDNEANPKNELGNNPLDISQAANQPWTGCDHNGTEAFPGGGFVSAALGQGFVTPGVPNSTSSSYGPLSSNTTADGSSNRPMYGLSEVFEVTDATLSDLTMQGTTGGQTVVLNPAYDAGTSTYTALVGNGIDEVTLTATKNDSNATVVITGDDDTGTPGTADLDLSVGDTTLIVTVTAEDTTTTLTYTVIVTRVASGAAIPVPDDWSLIPSSISTGDSFRLIFLSSTNRNANSASIDTYNAWVQARAAAGHDDIQAYSTLFNVVGCTDAVDARDNTSTTYTNANKGVPIYWLNGAKVADEYEDFYDGSWDDEANDKNESGNNGPDTSQIANYPFTGCDDDGTESFSFSDSYALGKNTVRIARPNSAGTITGPISSNTGIQSTNSRPMYGLSSVFTVTDLSDATLSSLMMQGTANGETIDLNPTFVAGTFTYTATAAHSIDTVTLSATKNHSGAMVAITDDDDANTKNEADLNLSVGANILTVTVTAEDTTTTETYTITVTRTSADATLSNLAIDGTPGGQGVALNPAFDADTFTYTASIANRIDAVTLTATTNHGNAKVAITGDSNVSTPDTADLDLTVGSNTLTVTVTAEDANTTQTYTITATRATEPPAPTDCPTDTDWCTTMGVGYLTGTSTGLKTEFWGYQNDASFGDLRSATFSHTGTSYTVTQLRVFKNTFVSTNTVSGHKLSLVANPPLPDGMVLQVGDRTFTVDTDSDGSTRGHEQWDIEDNPLNWTEGQHVTTSLTFTGAYDDATLSSLAIEGATNGESITLGPAFHENTISYTAAVPNGIDAVTVTAAANNSNATVVITGDDDSNSPDTAEPGPHRRRQHPDRDRYGTWTPPQR